jgi:hypothetical protein
MLALNERVQCGCKWRHLLRWNYTHPTVWCVKALRPAEEMWVDQAREGGTSTHEDAGSVEWPVPC